MARSPPWLLHSSLRQNDNEDDFFWLRYCVRFVVEKCQLGSLKDSAKSMTWSFGSVIVAENEFSCHGLRNSDVRSLPLKPGPRSLYQWR